MELRGLIKTTKMGEKKKEMVTEFKAVFRDRKTTQYYEIDLTELIDLCKRDVIKSLNNRLKREGKKLIIPEHLKHLESSPP